MIDGCDDVSVDGFAVAGWGRVSFGDTGGPYSEVLNLVVTFQFGVVYELGLRG